MFRLREIYKIIGNNLKEYRNEKGFTQEKFAKKIGLKRITLVNMENGKQKIPLDVLYIIADIFTVAIDRLLPTKEEIKKIISKNKKQKFDSFSEEVLSEEEKKHILHNVLQRGDD